MKTISARHCPKLLLFWSTWQQRLSRLPAICSEPASFVLSCPLLLASFLFLCGIDRPFWASPPLINLSQGFQGIFDSYAKAVSASKTNTVTHKGPAPAEGTSEDVLASLYENLVNMGVREDIIKLQGDLFKAFLKGDKESSQDIFQSIQAEAIGEQQRLAELSLANIEGYRFMDLMSSSGTDWFDSLTKIGADDEKSTKKRDEVAHLPLTDGTKICKRTDKQSVQVNIKPIFFTLYIKAGILYFSFLLYIYDCYTY